ncbi:MAG: hypothetical protein RBS99_09950 [Rhodospirillales bacterium]|nr:hypothetical protein [Rhodospirillales bacterium]
MIYADAYPLAIPEQALHAAAEAVRGTCCRKAAGERRTCARQLVAATVCPCATDDACLMDSLIEDLLEKLSDHEEVAAGPHPDSCRLSAAGPDGMPTTPQIAACLRATLRGFAGRGLPVPCVMLAAPLARRISEAGRRLHEALELLMCEDAECGKPFIASLAVVPTRGGLPGPWFFDSAARLGRFVDPADPLETRAFHARELHRAVAYWRRPEV